MNALFRTKFSTRDWKSARWEFWPGIVVFSLLFAAIDKLGFHRGPTIRAPRTWGEVLDDLPYILIVAFIVSVILYFGELYAIKKIRDRKRDGGG